MSLEQVDLTLKAGDYTFNHRTTGILIQDSAILLERNAKENYWALPGGRVQSGESSQTAVVREWLEELGSDVAVNRLIAVLEQFFVDNEMEVERNFHEISMYYLLEYAGTANQVPFRPGEFFCGPESPEKKYCWIPLTELEEITFFPLTIKGYLTNLPDTTKHIIDDRAGS